MKRTNIFLDGQITGYIPDADGDKYEVTDQIRDFNYIQSKIAQVIKGLSSLPDNDFIIIYGGDISDGGSGTINISEGLAIGKNSDGDTRFIFIPELTGVAIPSGWNDDRQIWVVGEHAWKYGSEERTHATINNEQYNYTVEDSYTGESSTDDLFVDSNPNSGSETVVCWGSFKMNGASFSDISAGIRSSEFIISSKLSNIDNIEEKTSGNGVLIEGERVAKHRSALLELGFLGIKKRTADGSYTGDFGGITYGNSLFVAVGQTGEIQTSPDGITWTQRTAAGSYTGIFYGVTYGNGFYVAVGQTGEIQTSHDGITWTQGTADGSYTGIFYGVTYGNGFYVAVGQTGEIQFSVNGLTWYKTPSSGSYTGDFGGITYGNSLFVAVGASGEIQTSPDGTTWTQRTADGGYTNVFRGTAYQVGLYIAVGSPGEIQTSPDGITWTQRTADGGYADNFEEITCHNGLSVIVGGSGEIQTTEKITLP